MAWSVGFFSHQGDPHIKVKHVEWSQNSRKTTTENAMDLSDPERFLEETNSLWLVFQDTKITNPHHITSFQHGVIY